MPKKKSIIGAIVGARSPEHRQLLSPQRRFERGLISAETRDRLIRERKEKTRRINERNAIRRENERVLRTGMAREE